MTDVDEAQPEAVVEQPGPLITGDAKFLWSGAAAVVVILIAILVLLGRWRAGRRASRAELPADFFQPAGEHAEITFDDATRSTARAESPVVVGDFQFDEPAPEELKRKGSMFGGLFGRRGKKNEIPPADESGAIFMDNPSFATVTVERDDPYRAPSKPEPAVDWERIEREARERADEDAARERREDLRRREEAEAQARWRSIEEERQLRLAEEEARRTIKAAAEREAAERAAVEQALFERGRLGATPAPHAAGATVLAAASPAAHDELSRTLSEVEEALYAQREAIQAETRSLLDGFARRFGDRLDTLAASVAGQSLQQTENSARRAALLDDEDNNASALISEMGRRLDEHRKEISGALSALARRLDQISGPSAEAAALRGELADVRRSLNAAAAPTAPATQLAEIIRNALAPGGYEFDALLSNNRRADCLIRLARPPGPIAIDASFPVEAFQTLHERRSEGAENEFRRLALRHIAGVAERLISPGFTADSAMMFLPSEAMASEFHARFPDLVQDSYRARVWIVSPTSLMATLHTLTAFLRDAPRREEPPAAEAFARRAFEAVERLGERVDALERRPADRREPSALRSANDFADRRRADDGEAQRRPAIHAVPDEEEHSSGDLYTDDAQPGERANLAQRPPFPLR